MLTGKPLPSYKGFSEAELRKAFSLVHNPENWKYPIDATVPSTVNPKLIEEAVIYFTGSVPEITRLKGGKKLRVKAAGYYLTIGA